MKKILFVLVLLLIAACGPLAPNTAPPLGNTSLPNQITNFEQCVAAGNPVMESNPRQCTANGQVFVEVLQVQFHECTVEESKAQTCDLVYRPVCGIVDNGIRCVRAPCQSTDAKTFGNGCQACSEKAYGYYEGECAANTFVVCGETVTGFDPVEYARNNNGICVDICPKNFDSYMTQIGVQLCIEHYGVNEIQAWDTCTRSSERCNCVKAYETTSEEKIANAKYRCVPEKYADRLLFRSGLDRLDENGDPSVAIA